MSKIEYRHQASAEFRFFAYDPEGDGFTFYRSAEDRDAALSGIINEYLDEHWSEEVENVCAGEVTHIAKQVDREERPSDPAKIEEEGWPPDCDYRCNYVAAPISQPHTEGGNG